MRKTPSNASSRSHCDQRGDENDLLRLDVVDFRVFEALCVSKVDLVVKVSGVCNERIVLQLLLVVQSDDVEVRRRLDTFKVRLQGAEGVTTYEYHDHEERKRNPCLIRTQTRASQQS